MSDIILSYKGIPIIDLSASGNKTIKTGGKYCEADLLLQYNRPSGGGAFILITSTKGATLTCGDQTYTLTGDEQEHAFAVSLGTYVCTASKDGNTKSETVVVSEEIVYKVEIIPPRLPAGYQEVEWLMRETDAYLNTYFTPNWDTYTEVNFSYTSAFETLGGVDSGSSQRSAYGLAYLKGDSILGPAYSNSNYPISSNWSFALGENIHWVQAGRQCSVNQGDVGYGHLFTEPEFEAMGPMFFFGLNRSGQMLSEKKGTLKIKHIVIRQDFTTDNELVRDFIPCYRTSDNKPGMYDLAGSICPLTNSPFYINAGSGEFIVGPDVI